MELIPEALPHRWRERAELLRDWGADEGAARLWERAAGELEQALRASGDETLTLVQAARETGLTADHVGDLVRRGVIPNAGRKGAPRIRRADLPIKQPKHGPTPERPLRVGDRTRLTELKQAIQQGG